MKITSANNLHNDYILIQQYDRNDTTAKKSIMKSVKLQSLVAKCYKIPKM